MKTRLSLLLFFFFPIILLTCQRSSPEPDVETLFAVDRSFSDMSAREGMVAAFIYYCHDEAVMLRANSMPIVGKGTISERLSSTNDSLFTLTWEPLAGDISSSGDMGFTYGVYTMILKTDTTKSKGTYVSIWKKNSEGEWKFVMDTGQEGLE